MSDSISQNNIFEQTNAVRSVRIRKNRSASVADDEGNLLSNVHAFCFSLYLLLLNFLHSFHTLHIKSLFETKIISPIYVQNNQNSKFI